MSLLLLQSSLPLVFVFSTQLVYFLSSLSMGYCQTYNVLTATTIFPSSCFRFFDSTCLLLIIFIYGLLSNLQCPYCYYNLPFLLFSFFRLNLFTSYHLYLWVTVKLTMSLLLLQSSLPLVFVFSTQL